MSWYKGKSNLRSKPQVSRVFTLIFTVASATLALAFGLSLRPWFSGGSAEAKSQAQAQVEGLAQVSAFTTSGTSPEAINSPVAAELLAQTVNGIEVTATNFRREGSQVKADVCFVTLDNSDWIIWSVSLKYAKNGKPTEVSDFGTTPIELREFPVNGQQRVITFGAGGEKNVHSEPAATGQMGRRCDTLYFEVPVEADLSNLNLTIHSIGASPDEGEACTFYLDKVQKALDVRKTGIKLQCTEESWGSSVTVVSKPASMSQEEADRIVFSDEFFTIKGPWTFATSVK
jgi:hypothetical protein